jgi:sugar-specific transcriptional regulator TrmB
MRKPLLLLTTVFLPLFLALLVGGCSKTYYSAMEKVGVHKRDILVDRVEEARDSQTEAQQQFKSALEQFGSVVELKNTDLKQAYNKFEKEFTDCEKAALKVSDRIDKVENVSEALFDEWEDELKLYENKELRQSSKKQLQETQSRYMEMLASMHAAEKSMKPVLRTFRDNVLFLKHNLNAQAIGSLQLEFSSLEKDIDGLLRKMNMAIAHSNTFIAQMSP